ncbi:MAG: hypothetical protein WC939_01960 [Acholeplasmataceae bacterium]
MVKKVIGLMIGMLLLFSLVACKEDEMKIPFELSNRITNYFDTDERETLLQIVNSLDGLTQLMGEKEFDISQMYEESFFENKVLILYFFIESTDVQFEIKLEKVDSDTLKVEKVYDLGDGTPNTIVVPYAFIIEVSKDDIAENSNIKLEGM